MVVITAGAAAARRGIESEFAAAAATAAAAAVSAHPGGRSRSRGKREEGGEEGGRVDGAAVAVRRLSILMKIRTGKGVNTVNISELETLRRGWKPAMAFICAADV